MTAQWTNHVHSFQVQLMRVLLLNLSSSSAEEVSKALQSEDHVLLKACNVGVDAIISLGTQVLFAEATPFDLSCWHLISQMKSVSDQPIPKIVLIVYGGALERSRALELGADHVLSGPIEPVGLSAQIKAAIQTKEAGACRKIQPTRALEKGRTVEDTVEASTSRDTESKTFGIVHGVLVFTATLVAISTAIVNWHSLVPQKSKPVEARHTGQFRNREGQSRNTEQARVPPTSGTAPDTHPIGKQQVEQLRQWDNHDNYHREVLKEGLNPASPFG
jgi:response regulator RpfG family c-di-GMP phosphodiesterase